MAKQKNQKKQRKSTKSSGVRIRHKAERTAVATINAAEAAAFREEQRAEAIAATAAGTATRGQLRVAFKAGASLTHQQLLRIGEVAYHHGKKRKPIAHATPTMAMALAMASVTPAVGGTTDAERRRCQLVDELRLRAAVAKRNVLDLIS